MSKEITTVTRQSVYEGIDKDVAGKLVHIEGQIVKNTSVVASVFIDRCGLVNQAHELLVGGGCEGKFSQWVELQNISRRTAYNYLAVWGRFSECKNIEQFEPTAMIEFSQSDVPEVVFKKAMKESKRIAFDGQTAKEFIKAETSDGKCATVAHLPSSTNKKPSDSSSSADEIEYEDVEREPGIDDETPEESEQYDKELPDEPVKAKPVDLKDQAAKLKSIIKQHNAAMMRAVDDLHGIEPKKPIHDKIHQYFRAIHEAVEEWK